MRLSDIMAAAGLTSYAEAALIIFFVVFVAVVVRLFWPGRRSRYDADSRLPFEDRPSTTPSAGDRE